MVNSVRGVVARIAAMRFVATLLAIALSVFSLAGKAAGYAMITVAVLIAVTLTGYCQTDAAGVLDAVTTLITSWKAVAAGLCLFLIGLSIVRKLH